MNEAPTVERVMEMRSTSLGPGSFIAMDPQDLAHQLRERILEHANAKDVDIVIHRTIIEKHEGKLHFESARGVGTTATVWLPGRR